MKKILVLLIILLAICVSAFVYLKISKAKTDDKVKIVFFDVGQGDASFIEFENDEQMLVDCGRDAKILNLLGRKMKFYDKTLDYLVVTHPDNDHYGGCVDVLKRFEVKNIIYNDVRKTGDAEWDYFWKTVQEENAVYYGLGERTVLEISDAKADFLFPDQKMTGEIKDNDGSIVFVLTVSGKKIIFTGDAEEWLENYLVQNYFAEIDAYILKVSHHGSKSSSGEEFVKAVSPEISVISVGADNKYGHPSDRVVNRLERAGSDIFRTDWAGNVEFEF